MATQFTKLQVINAALLAMGEVEVAENDGSNEWRVLEAQWAPIVEAELEDSNYAFSKVQANLLTRIDGIFGYNDGFQLPPAALHVRHAWIQDSSGSTGTYGNLSEDPRGTSRKMIEWVTDAGYIYVNKSDGVWVEYLEVPDPSVFSATFISGIKMKLQAAALRSLREEYTDADRMDARADAYLQRARTNSSKSQSARPVTRSRSRFAQARFSRG